MPVRIHHVAHRGEGEPTRQVAAARRPDWLASVGRGVSTIPTRHNAPVKRTPTLAAGGSKGWLTALLIVTSAVGIAIPLVVAVLFDPFWLISAATTMVLAISGFLLVRIAEQRTTGYLLMGAASTANLVQLNFWKPVSGYFAEVAFITYWLPLPLLALAFLTYPEGGIGGRQTRLFMVVAWIWAIVPHLAAAMMQIGHGVAPSEAWFGLVDWPEGFDVMVCVGAWGSVVMGVGATMISVVRWVGARGSAKALIRFMSAATVVLAWGVAAREIGGLLFRAGRIERASWDRIGDVHQLFMMASVFTVGFTVYRSFARSAHLTEHVLSTAGDPLALQDMLRNELIDPSVELLFRVDGEWMNVSGTPSTPPTGPDRDVVELASTDGRPAVVASLDPLDRLDPVRRRVALSAAGMALNAAAVTVERDAYVAELAASRTRITAAGEAQRRELERMLHDGIQQSLLATTATLSRAKLAGGAGDSGQVAASIDQATTQLLDALADLRQVARGIYPAALAESGLVGGAQSLADRWPGLVLDIRGPEQGFDNMGPDQASVLYFALSEGLSNAHKYGKAPVRLVLSQDRDTVTGEVHDSGPGGAVLEPGGGLAGLRDRVRALGGRFDLSSPAGGPTVFSVTLPRV